MRARGVVTMRVLGAAAAGVPSAASAQGLTDRPARPEDVATLDAIVEAFYDVISRPEGRPVDWARDSTLYLADLRFKIVDRTAAGPRVRIVDHATYAEATSDQSEGFFEREIHRVTQRFGPIAQVFSTYEWRLSENGPVGGRGINALELVFVGDRWWIGSATWTAEGPDDPIPPAYLPPGS